MKKRTAIILLMFGCIQQSVFSIEPVYSFPIPDKTTFADKTISLERYDMRERYDREQIIIAYNHSVSFTIIKRANRYFPIIEPILKENGIPNDFKYLAVIESNLDPRAISPAQAAGLWQLLPKTAQQFGLEVNDEIDERYHIEKSTIATCKYLKSAYAKFKNWTTVAASYNAGMGRISTEKENQQVEDSFDMLLSSESSRYVFRLLAMKRFLENPKAFGYILDRNHFYQTVGTKDTIINSTIEDWTVWAQRKGISYYQLKDFNIWIRGRKLTNKDAKKYTIQIPNKEDITFNPNKIKIHNPAWISY